MYTEWADDTPANQTLVTTQTSGNSHKKRPFKISLLVLLLVSIGLGAAGTYYWQHKKVISLNDQVYALSSSVVNLQKDIDKLQPVSKTAASSSAQSTTNPYVGWNTYTFKLEKITFHYPSTWTLKDMSDAGNDFEVLSGTNNFQMTIGAGAAISSVNYPLGGSYVVQADPVTFNGKQAYLDAWTDDGSSSSSIYSIWLSQSKTNASDFFPSKNITTNASNSHVVALIDYNPPGATHFTNEPLSYVENDTNYKDAQLVIDSMTY